MAKVKRSVPTPTAPATSSAAAAKAKKPAVAAKVKRPAAAIPAAKGAAPAPATVIEIPSSPDYSEGGCAKVGSDSKGKARRKRPAPPLDLDDEVQMWTPREKRRLDEECEILAADPLEVAPAPAAATNDDIAVVAERGKVACRDYPHPRSACAKHPFNTTPHERHCDKCFCYVCDTAAPCVSWRGTGGHCHASDNDNKWKIMRQSQQKQRK